MFVAALILLLVAVLLIISAVFGGGASASLDLGAFDLNTNSAGVFFLGMATLLVLVLSLAMFRAAARRTRARRAERKQMGELNERLEAYRRDEHPDGPTDEG